MRVGTETQLTEIAVLVGDSLLLEPLSTRKDGHPLDLTWDSNPALYVEPAGTCNSKGRLVMLSWMRLEADAAGLYRVTGN